jgi:hypothetical protein
VPRLSSLFEIPAQLAMLLSLAASAPGHDAVIAETPKAAISAAPSVVEPIAGALRFTDRGWLRALHENPVESAGLGSRIFVTSGGRYYVPMVTDRRRVSEARNNDELARRVTKAAARRDAAKIRVAVKREPAATDLYVAHVYGVGTAISLIQAVVATPDAPLDRSFPEIAALPEVKQGAGAPITVVQFYRRLGAALAEPSRLVAIGLNPATAATTGAEPAARDSLVAWQTKVDVARAGSRTQ